MELLRNFCNFIRIDMVNAGFEDFKEPVLMLPFSLMIGTAYLLVRKSLHKKRFGGDFPAIRRECRLNELVRFLFATYAAALFMLTLLPSGIFEKLLIFSAYGQWYMPLYEIRRFNFGDILPWMARVFQGYRSISELINGNNILNAALFVPFGAALPIIWEKLDFRSVAVLGALLSLFIEMTQIFIMRDPNLDDIICNTFGAVLGYLLYLLMKRLFPKFTEKCGKSAAAVCHSSFSRP